jgi:hypothetical protein
MTSFRFMGARSEGVKNSVKTSSGFGWFAEKKLMPLLCHREGPFHLTMSPIPCSTMKGPRHTRQRVLAWLGNVTTRRLCNPSSAVAAVHECVACTLLISIAARLRPFIKVEEISNRCLIAHGTWTLGDPFGDLLGHQPEPGGEVAPPTHSAER